MIRRSPTRIELKLDDMVEFHPLKREFEATKEQRLLEQKSWIPAPTTKSKQEIQQIIHDRIGYNPQPRPSS